MTKKITLSILALALIMPVLASAQEASVRTRAASSTKVEVKTNKLAERQANVRAHADELFDRIMRTGAQLSELLVRVNSRIAKLDATNKDVIKAKTAATDAQTALDKAGSSLADLRLQIENAASSTKPVQAFQPLKTNLKGVIQNFRTAHQKIVDAIKSLKSASVSVNATSTQQ